MPVKVAEARGDLSEVWSGESSLGRPKRSLLRFPWRESAVGTEVVSGRVAEEEEEEVEANMGFGCFKWKRLASSLRCCCSGEGWRWDWGRELEKESEEVLGERVFERKLLTKLENIAVREDSRGEGRGECMGGR